MKNNLKQQRLRIGLTQVQIAKKAGISERGYQRYEADEKSTDRRIPDVVTAIRIAKTLNSTVEEIWGKETAQGATQ